MFFLEVINAEYLGEYRVKLWFNNDVIKCVDLKDSLVGLVFEPLKNVDYFKRFSVKFNTIEWSNGADFAPEYLTAACISSASTTKMEIKL